MSAGHKHGDEPAPLSAVVRMIQSNPGLGAHLARRPFISREWRVPYLAGSSIDGRTVYIDAQVPERLPESGVEPDYGYPPHECFEWWCMARLGMDYGRAHRLAHGFEQMQLRLAGIGNERIEQYEAESVAMWRIDEHLKLPPEAFPPDLYLGPYEEDQDADDERLLPLLRAAQALRPMVGYG